MPDFRLYAGETSQTVYMRLRDSTTGLGKTGLVFNSAGVTASYTLPGAARAAITLVTLASASAAWSSGGFILVDDTNCKGLYRLDLPNAAIASGKFTIISIEFDGIIEESMVIPLEVPDANTIQWLGTAAATPTVAGVPEVDITHQGGGAIPAPAVTGVPDVNMTHHVDVAASVTTGELDVNVGQIIGTAPTLTTGDLDVNVATMTAASIASGTIAAAELTNIENEIWDALKSAHVVANSFGDFLDIEVSSRLASADINLTAGAVDTVTTNTDMRGTDSAALASVVGALADAAAAGEVTSADTLMQYIKQLINILVGLPGVTTFPAEAAPGNGVSLAEVIRAIHADVTGLAGSAMIGTNSAALASVCTEARLSELDEATAGKMANQVDIIEIDTTSLNDTKIPDTISLANINGEVVDVLTVDTTTLPGQTAPPLAPTMEQMLGWLYKVLRNRTTQTATQWSLLADDESTVDAKATVSDDTTTAIVQEIVTGP